ncbi:hypothetical protein SLS58_002567 [Diplodia intermedia]|uniref:Uncharacterized protein n=1 Tax=Diplodia intermedia TaxID=856260 RepID=A0ABR3TYR7_9PEZI
MATQSPPVPPRSALRNKNLRDVEESSTSSVLRGKGGQISSTVWADGGIFGRDKNNRYAAKRRGLWRLVLIAAIIIVAIIALSLGLAFGLRKTNHSDSATWSCYPYVIYNSNKKKAMTTLNWIITGSEGNYKISSTDNELSVDFEDVDLVLYSEGQDSERYHFQFTMDKEVVPTTSITDDDSSTVCYFNSTIFTGYLYTKMEKDYPTDDTSDNAWPFAVRAEQSIGGGEDVPNCYKTVDGRITKQITDGLDAMGASTLCSCLYRNYLTK